MFNAGGINLFGPKIPTGDALLEKIGSVKIIVPFKFIKKLTNFK